MERMLVVGAGTMGRGIAHVGAVAGFEVTVFDAKAEQVAAALEAIRKNLQKGVDRGKLSAPDMEAAAARLWATTDMEAAASEADVVIEAAGVPETLRWALAMLRRGGRCAAVGIPTVGVDIDMKPLVLDELELVGSRASTPPSSVSRSTVGCSGGVKQKQPSAAPVHAARSLLR